VRILAISDIEVRELRDNFAPNKFGKIDLVLSCGDLPPEYLTHIRERINAPLYYILGNHDLRYRQSPPVGCMDLSFTTTRIGNLNLLGLSGSRWYNGGKHQYHEPQMRLQLLKLYFTLWRTPVDVVVAHSPLRHVHDAEDRCHRGFRSFHKLINRFKPKYFLHGHIHADFQNDTERITRINETQIINCCGFYVFDI
jgi:Icc-related predicted phosphoesterase